MLALSSIADYSLRNVCRNGPQLFDPSVHPLQGASMLTLLNLLSAVTLLIWGTHIVRTGILRV